MALLLRKPEGASGLVHDISPETAGWSYVGFALYRLAPGERVAAATHAREVCHKCHTLRPAGVSQVSHKCLTLGARFCPAALAVRPLRTAKRLRLCDTAGETGLTCGQCGA